MSLSSLITLHRPTKQLFAGLPDLRDSFHTIARLRKRGAPLRVPCKALEPIIVGTAYDYWLRAWVTRTWPHVPRQERQWIAESAFEFMPEFSFDTPETQAIERRLLEIRDIYSGYVAGGEKLLLPFLEGCLFLARLDIVYRTSVEVPDFFVLNRRDLDDLVALTKLTSLRRYLFEPKQRLIMNPEFGAMSRAVCGADADLIIDDRLIDIKVSGRARGPWALHQRQLVGYWLLAALEGTPWPIRHLEVYLARNGVLYSAPVTVVLERVDVLRFAAAFLAEVDRFRQAMRLKSDPPAWAPRMERLQEVVRSWTEG